MTARRTRPAPPRAADPPAADVPPVAGAVTQARRGRARRRATRGVLLGAAVVALGACGASAVNVPPAPLAADPVCAQVLQVLPGMLGDAERRPIANQATAAWGQDPAITLRCGIQPPGPSTERCITVESGETSVDWLALEADDELVPDHAQRDSGTWTFISYGRVPAVEVVVPVEHAGDQPTALLVTLGTAVERTSAERACVGVTDVY